MLDLFLFALAVVMIWIAWGFWAFLAALAARIVIGLALKPKYGYEVNWGTVIAHFGIVVVGIIAVIDKWHEPVYTAAAVIIAVLLTALAIRK